MEEYGLTQKEKKKLAKILKKYNYDPRNIIAVSDYIIICERASRERRREWLIWFDLMEKYYQVDNVKGAILAAYNSKLLHSDVRTNYAYAKVLLWAVDDQEFMENTDITTLVNIGNLVFSDAIGYTFSESMDRLILISLFTVFAWNVASSSYLLAAKMEKNIDRRKLLINNAIVVKSDVTDYVNEFFQQIEKLIQAEPDKYSDYQDLIKQFKGQS